MVGCLTLLAVLLLLGLAVVLVPLGTALSLGQAAVVTALLYATARVAWSAWRESGSLALVFEGGGREHCFPALPEDPSGQVLLSLELHHDGPEVHVAPPPDAGPTSVLALLIARREARQDAAAPPTRMPGPTLTFQRRKPGARRGRLTVHVGGTLVWFVEDLKLGSRQVLPPNVAELVADAASPGVLAVTFLDR